MRGKVAMVTGASSGVGQATAEGLAARGARVAMVCRSEARGAAARDAILARTGASPEAVAVWLCDLASMAQVRDLAKRFHDAHERLDVLVNNAGGMQARRRETEDRREATMAVNHLAPFLLTHALLPLLRAAAADPARREARVVNVASEAHWTVRRAHLDDLDHARARWRSWHAYAESKLANVLFTRELARRLEGTGVTANSCHPGTVRSGFFRAAPWWARAGGYLLWPLLTSPRRAARTVLHLAASPEVRGVTGGYWARSRPRAPSPLAQDGEAARRLWAESARLTGVPADEPSRPSNR